MVQHNCETSFEAIGTHWTVCINQPIDAAKCIKVKQEINHRIAVFDKTYSRFRDDSLITKIATSAGEYTFPDDAKELFAFYRQLYEVTDGKVTPLIGSVLAESGYDASYTLKPNDIIHRASKWDDVMSYVHPTLTVHSPVLLDLGAAGKGYLVDIIGKLLDTNGITSYVVDGSGDMLRKDPTGTTIDVGLADPRDTTQVIGVVQLGNGSICGSAGNRRQWAGLHHIMDPDTAEPTSAITASWVKSDTAMVADGLATALFFTDAGNLQRTFSFEYCLVRSDHSSVYSKDFHAELFSL